MGSVYQRGRIWWIQYYDRGRKLRETSGSSRKTDAVRFLKQREGAIQRGDRVPIRWRQVTFEELGEGLVQDYKLNQHKSLARARQSIGRLEKFLGGLKASKIDDRRVRDYMLRRREWDGVANATINRELAALRRAFNLAVEARLFPSNRVPRIRMLPEKNIRQGFFTPDEYAAIRRALPLRLQPIVDLAYYTGMRKGEILALRWDQVDLDTGRVHLDENTKSGYGRMVPLPHEARRSLHAHRRQAPPRARWVFTYRGKRLLSFRKAWSTACKEAEVGSRYFHDFRRTAVRNMVRAGVPERVAMAISGHRTRSVFDRYNITSERDLDQAVRRLEAYAEPRKSAKVVRLHGITASRPL